MTAIGCIERGREGDSGYIFQQCCGGHVHLDRGDIAYALRRKQTCHAHMVVAHMWIHM